MRVRPTLLLISVLCAPIAALSQPAAPPLPTVIAPSSQARLSPAELNRLVAPVALYPDALLAGILAASTYPAEVVEAQRFLADPANAGLTLSQLTDAAESRGWDASVAGLLAYPGVLRMMDADLDWTDRLGRAFVAQQAEVMGAVQALRQMAQQAGTLLAGAGVDVVDDGDDVVITAPSPQQAVVPSYDPACVFASAPGCDAAQQQVSWSDAGVLPYDYVAWGYVDWSHRLVRVGRRDGAGGAVWRHGAGGVARLSGGWARKAGNAGFSYAPPANVPFSVRGARSVAPAPVVSAIRPVAPRVAVAVPHVVARPMAPAAIGGVGLGRH